MPKLNLPNSFYINSRHFKDGEIAKKR